MTRYWGGAALTALLMPTAAIAQTTPRTDAATLRTELDQARAEIAAQRRQLEAQEVRLRALEQRLSTLASALRDVIEVPYASLPGFGSRTGMLSQHPLALRLVDVCKSPGIGVRSLLA